jgi:DtxR family transcriptional regulator, Mn-dependent transcriptional regulator
MTNISKEDYLSTIYKYRDSEGSIKPTIIAEKLNISNAAVTDMLKKLALDGQIKYEKYKGIKLTMKGEDFAKNMIRRHRIWEVYLHRVIGMPWHKVHSEAHRLEHSSSDELISRLEEILNYPEFDPHGEPIPDKKGKIPKIKNNIPLSQMTIGESAKVVKVSDDDDKFLDYIAELGISINENISVKERRSFDSSLLIIVKGQPWNISEKIAQNVFVEIKEGKRKQI